MTDIDINMFIVSIAHVVNTLYSIVSVHHYSGAAQRQHSIVIGHSSGSHLIPTQFLVNLVSVQRRQHILLEALS